MNKKSTKGLMAPSPPSKALFGFWFEGKIAIKIPNVSEHCPVLV